MHVIRWARRKFKRMRQQTKGARDWFDRLRRANPNTLCTLGIMSWQRPNVGSRVTREGHARLWERPEVKFLRVTRQVRRIACNLSALPDCRHERGHRLTSFRANNRH
jgi:hypothetical protein